MKVAEMKTGIGLAVVGLALTFGSGYNMFAQGAPIPKAHIYPTTEAADGDIKAAILEAHKTHKRVILDFGGDWCGDCQVLNIYYHQSPNAELLAKNFVLVFVNIGKEDANLDIASKYGVPMPHGVPALVVLDGHGRILYSQKNEFSDMRHMEATSVTEFLNKWKP